jgi:hypothetical protein
MFSRSQILGVNQGSISYAGANQSNVVSATASRGFGAKQQVTAGVSGFGGGGGAASMSVNSFFQSNYQYTLTGILPADPHLIDTSTLALFYRRQNCGVRI